VKIEWSIKLSLGVFALVVLLCFGSLFFFYVKYSDKSSEILELTHKRAVLLQQKQEYEKYGRVTLEYFRISKTLDKISGKKIPEKTQIALTERLLKLSRSYDIDPLLILAIVLQESRGNPNTKGRYQSGAESGAYGLMQLKIETAQTLGRMFGIRIETADDLMKPEINMVLGTAYLMRLIGHYEDVRNAVIAYNLGQGKVDRLLAEGRKLPTKYFEGVMSKYRALEQDLDNSIRNLDSLQ